MLVKILKLHEDAVIPYKAHPSDFCYDCVAVSEEEIAPNIWKYKLGIAFQLERYFTKPCNGMMITTDPADKTRNMSMFSMRFHLGECELDLSIDARPRSSVWKTGMILSNCEGTIDENYRGEVSAVFYHLMPNMPRYKVGDRVCQIKIGMALPMEFVEVEELSNTDRGTKGYGSSGK